MLYLQCNTLRIDYKHPDQLQMNRARHFHPLKIRTWFLKVVTDDAACSLPLKVATVVAKAHNAPSCLITCVIFWANRCSFSSFLKEPRPLGASLMNTCSAETTWAIRPSIFSFLPIDGNSSRTKHLACFLACLTGKICCLTLGIRWRSCWMTASALSWIAMLTVELHTLQPR